MTAKRTHGTAPIDRASPPEERADHASNRDGGAHGSAQAVVDALPTPLVVLDAGYRVVSTNKAFCAAFATTSASLIGRPLVATAARGLDTPSLRAMVDRVGAAGQAADGFELSIELPNGGLRNFSPTASRMEDRNAGDILVALHDVTELRGTERTLIEAEEASRLANLAKSRFLATASHDLRQPLQTLSLLHGTLRQHLVDREALATLASAEHTCEAMKGIVAVLLDLDRLERRAVRPDVTEFALREIFDALDREFAPLAAAKGLAWRRVDCGLFVRSDPLLLEIMIRNLLSNAVRYTDRGRVLLGRRRRGNRLRIEVWDTGIGIADEQMPRIFEEYRRTPDAAERGGLGLGLALVQSFAALLGHTIDARSRIGKGSVFAIEVPLLDRPSLRRAAPRASRQQASGVAAVATAAPSPPPSERDARPAIAIVDDDRDTRAAAQLLLVKAGYRVRSFAAAQAFLDAHRPGDTSCLIADVRLPGMSGLEMLARLAAAGDTPPTIFISGQADIGVAVEAMRAGAVDFIEKPVAPEVLLAATDRALHKALSPSERSAARTAAAMRLAGLTKRERDVMTLIVAGLANKEVAGRLGINRRTVEAHRATIMRKMGARSLSDLVRFEIAAHAAI